MVGFALGQGEGVALIATVTVEERRGETIW